MDLTAARVWEFGDFCLDLEERRLLRPGGDEVPLTPRVFETLRFLVQHHDRVIEKGPLMKAVWPDCIVEDNNLAQTISTLRRIFGESAAAPRYIATVPGRGYRFLPAVRPRGDETAKIEIVTPEPRRSRSHIFAAAFAGVILFAASLLWWRNAHHPLQPGSVVPEKSIAVLPFENLSADPENAFFAEGIKDEILTRLSKIAALKVISRSSTQQFKSPPHNLREIARHLGVANILEGSVQKAGDSVRVTLKLIEAASDKHLWAESYDRKMTGIFQVESEIAQEVANALATTLTGAEKRAVQSKQTVSAEAHQACLKGRYFWNKRNADGFKEALGYFRQAIALDPHYAAAHAGLSDACLFLAAGDPTNRKENYDLARNAAKQAIALDATLAEPHASLGLLAMNYHWDWITAEKEFRRAVELDPNYATAHHWYAEMLGAVGRFEESLGEIKRARQLDPLSLIINADTGKFLWYARRYPEAIEQLHEALKLDANFSLTHFWLGVVYATADRHTEAIAEFEKMNDSRELALTGLGYSYGISGQREKAGLVLDELNRLGRERAIDPCAALYVYIGLGEKDQAFAALEREYETHSVDLSSLKVNPFHDTLRSDPRFADLLRRTNFVAAEETKRDRTALPR